MTVDQLKADEKDCAADAHDYAFLNPGLVAPNANMPGGGTSGRVVVQDQGNLYRTCMNAKGYGRVPPPKTDSKTDSKAGPAAKPDTGM